MKLTPAQVQLAYDFLRSHPPFNKWRLPESQGVILKVMNSDMCFGDYEPDPHTIRVSKTHCEHFMHVMETVAHEMVHLAAEKMGHHNHAEHDETFKTLAKEVCGLWGWKEATF